MESRGYPYLVCVFTFIFYLIQSPITFSKTKTIGRPFEHVVITGDNFPSFDGAPINELFVYVYHAAEDKWEQIPFQFDERDAAGSYFDPSATPGQLDGRTELVVLVKDLGGRNINSWIADVASALFVRYEIEVTDPLTGEKGWFYLYHSNTLTLDPALTDYITYFASETGNPGEDRIQTPLL